MFGDTQVVRKSSSAEYLVPKIGFPDRAFVFDSMGRFTRSIRFDSIGQGNVGALYPAADSLFVFNNSRGHLVTIPKHSSPSAYAAYPGSVYRALRLSPDQWLVNGVFRTSNMFGQPLHVLSRRGVERSFGSLNSEFRPDRPYEGWRHIHVRGNEILSLSWTDPVLEIWRETGQLAARLPLRLPEFLPWIHGSRWGMGEPPRSLIDDLRIDENGWIWLLVSVAAPSWRGSVTMSETPDGLSALPTDWVGALSSWIIVINGKSGDVIFASRFRQYLRQFVSATEVMSLRGAPNTPQTLSIYRIDFRTGKNWGR